MFTARFQLFRVHGIPIRVDLSWLIILALLTLGLTNLYAHDVPQMSEGSCWAMGLATALAFFACIVLHELGHALVARHLEIPLNGITLFLLGGVSELEGEPKSAGNEFWMAIAGPFVSGVLAGIFWGLLTLGGIYDWPAAAEVFCFYLAWINVTVLCFNLVPAFPLDGGRVLRSVFWAVSGNLRRATEWASMIGQGFAWLLIGCGIFLFFTPPNELFLGFLVGGFFNGLLLVLVGLFINNAARASYQQVLIKQALRGERVRRFMTSEPIVVSPAENLRHWVEDYVYRYHHKAFPVVSDGHVEGIISTGMLTDFPREDWDAHTVSEVMRTDVEPISVTPDTDAVEALERIQHTGSSRLLVIEGGQLVGLVSLKDLLHFLQLKLELQDHNDEDQGPPTSWTRTGRREERPTHV